MISHQTPALATAPTMPMDASLGRVTYSRPAKVPSPPIEVTSAGFSSLSGHCLRATQVAPAAEGHTSPQVKHTPIPLLGAPAGTTSTAAANLSPTPNLVTPLPHETGRSHGQCAAHIATAPASHLPGSQGGHDAHWTVAAGDLTPQGAQP